ncbi:uncharacterized protein N7511_000436 [Penicillium nucicola]|uniref:uncharacterized protein n=1 Tax=Penicillium nucicola TaxID=1850975 RepID=UPI0025454A23|nr:uncharacterized protein N7511_000436 [Penicillium nucicola]KAJ5775425.1 hypothetical protein N7511_000436 [Penicillium nucicola]
MRWSVFFALVLSLLCVAGTLAAPAQNLGREIEARQEQEAESDKPAESTTSEASATQTNASTTISESTATATSTSSTSKSSATTGTGTATTTNAKSTTATAAEATSTVPSLDGATAASQQEAADSARPTYSGGLPIKPVITPALGVGGFILLALGAVLAFIGVRKQWVQIFLSTAFLTALGVTVLIVYVMSPPVSNAVQGGYVVAVFFTGAVFGGLSMVFKEICEGLGCLLGGFCLSMWFLALKSGGLLTESGPRTGMIIAFSVGFYCLSFSHYTRPYGLIGCSSFSGATALVLGIDCFSRAGLKEFWLYIWGLNQNIFPLKTNTYPVTRNIRVELAVTIIVSVLGVISQIRLWKVIKERRAKEEDARREHERKIEEEDAEAGRQLEEKNNQERAEWEMTYGNGQDSKSKTASVSETAVGEDSRRGSDGFTSSNDKDGDIEMKDMQTPEAGASSEKNDEARELEPVQEEDARELTEQEKEQGAEQENADSKARPETPVVTHVLGQDNDNSSENGAVIGSEAGTPRSKRMSGRELLNRLSWRNSTDMKVTSQSQEALVVHNDASSSVYGVADDADDLQEVSEGCPSIASDLEERVQKGPIQEVIVPENLPEKRSVEMDTKSNAGSQVVHENTTPEAKKPTVDTVATEHHDEQKDITPDPVPSKVVPQVSKEAGLGVITGAAMQNVARKVVSYEAAANKSTQPTNTAEPVAQTPIESTIASPLDRTGMSVMSEQLQSPDTPATDIQPDITDSPKSQQEETVALEQPSQQDGQAESVKEKETPPTIDQEKKEEEVIPLPSPKPVEKVKKEKVIKKLDASTVKALPEQTSRIIHSYRTNEWAKHLADADTPEMEPIEFDIVPEVEGTDEVHEAPAFVDVDGLLQTPLNAQPPPAVNRTESYEVEAIQPAVIPLVSSPETSRSKLRNSLSKAMHNPLSRNASTGSVNMLRSSSAQPAHPQEGQAGLRSASTPFLTITAPENKEAEQTPKWNGPPPLLAVREDMVRNRMSSTSLRYDPWASRNQTRQSYNEISPISPPLSVPEEREEDHEQGPPRDEDDIPLSKRRTMLQRQTIQSPYATSVHSLEAPSPAQSPPPGAELNRSASRMAAWRQSVRDEITNKRDPLALPPQSPPPGGAVSPDRPHSSLWGSVQQMRDASSNQLDNAVANGMQRGSMTDLHRQAMRPIRSSNRAPVEATPSIARAQRRQCVPISGPPSLILRPSAVRLANPVNHVPRITPITVPAYQSDESLPLSHGITRDAFPLLSVPERRRSRLTPSPSSLLVERSQGETESGRTSIALPPRHRRSAHFSPTDMAAAFAGSAAMETENLRPPEAVHLTQDGSRRRDDLSPHCLCAFTYGPTPPADVAEELAWGVSHPCFPHFNPHVPIGSHEHAITRVIRIRRDWMIKGDLAPTFSNLYPEILDPLLSEQEFRRVIATVNDGIIKAFDPFSFRNWFDGAMGLLTGWVWDDLNAPGAKSQLQHVESWLEKWNQEVGAKDGVYIWSLRRTAYMSLDIQIPDPKVGIVPSEAPSAPNTRPSTGIAGV